MVQVNFGDQRDSIWGKLSVRTCRWSCFAFNQPHGLIKLPRYSAQNIKTLSLTATQSKSSWKISFLKTHVPILDFRCETKSPSKFAKIRGCCNLPRWKTTGTWNFGPTRCFTAAAWWLGDPAPPRKCTSYDSPVWNMKNCDTLPHPQKRAFYLLMVGPALQWRWESILLHGEDNFLQCPKPVSTGDLYPIINVVRFMSCFECSQFAVKISRTRR